MDLHLSISDGFLKSKIYDKREDLVFDIVTFPFLDCDVPRSTDYGEKVLTAKPLKRGYIYIYH